MTIFNKSFFISQGNSHFSAITGMLNLFEKYKKIPTGQYTIFELHQKVSHLRSMSAFYQPQNCHVFEHMKGYLGQIPQLFCGA